MLQILVVLVVLSLLHSKKEKFGTLMFNDGITPIPSQVFNPQRNFSDIYIPFTIPAGLSYDLLAKEVILHLIDISQTPVAFVESTLSTYPPYYKPKPYWFITNTPTSSADTPEPSVAITQTSSSKNLINLNTLWNPTSAQNIQYLANDPRGAQYGSYTLPTTINGKLVLSTGNTYLLKIPGTYTSVINRPLILDRRYALGINFIVSSITPYPFTFPLSATNANPYPTSDTINNTSYYSFFTWFSFINNTSDYNAIFQYLQIPLSPTINNIEYTPLAAGSP